MNKSKTAENMIYSDEYHIPLGQAIKTNKGEYGLRVKNNSNTYEIITLNNLTAQIIQMADSNPYYAVFPSEEHA